MLVSMARRSPGRRIREIELTMLFISVLFQDYESYQPHNDTIHKVKWDGLWYVMAVTIYSMEGVGLILSLKASGQNQAQFPALFLGTITVISVFMAVFGAAGYIAFGDQTEAPITLNMASDWSAIFVKLALCLGLYLTFPIMMFPSKPQHSDSGLIHTTDESQAYAIFFFHSLEHS